MKKFISLIFSLFITTQSLCSEFAVKLHTSSISSADKFILCSNSGQCGVDCAVFSLKNNQPQLVLSAQLKNETFTSFTQVIHSFLQQIKNSYNIAIYDACFSGPGVPSAQQDYLTHIRLSYAIDAKEINKETSIRNSIVVNDFLAMSYGIDYIDPTKIQKIYDVPLQENANRVIIGAGHGLGTVSMIWDKHEQKYCSMPAEAGTGNFPAQSQSEFDMAQKMKQLRNMETVHWANFVSLSGIEYIYKMMQEMSEQKDLHTHISAQDILACSESSSICKKAVSLFYQLYARFTYNFVWNTLPFGGIYLIGETAENDELLKTIFLPEYFNCVISKRDLLKRMPLYVIKEKDSFVQLYGNVHYFLNAQK